MARFVDPTVAAERRRAIAEGLRTVLKPDSLEDALLHWDTDYAERKPHAVADYVEAVALRLKLSSKERLAARMAVMSSVLKTLQSPRTPASASTRRVTASTAPASPPTSMSPAMVVFAHMAEMMMLNLRRRGPSVQQSFLDALRAQLNHADSQLVLHLPTLMRWAAGMADLPPMNGVNEHGLSRLLHLIYVSVAQTLGPVPADTLLTLAVQQAEQLPAATRFPPRRML